MIFSADGSLIISAHFFFFFTPNLIRVGGSQQWYLSCETAQAERDGAGHHHKW